MVENDVNEGNVEANSSNTPEVTTEQNAQNVATEEVATQPTEEAPVAESTVEAPVAVTVDADEKILDEMFESGKTEVSTGELIAADFDTRRIGQYEFTIGKYKLSRLLLVSPYKIEK